MSNFENAATAICGQFMIGRDGTGAGSCFIQQVGNNSSRKIFDQWDCAGFQSAMRRLAVGNSAGIVVRNAVLLKMIDIHDWVSFDGSRIAAKN